MTVEPDTAAFRVELESLAAANTAYAESFDGQLRPVRPRRELVIVACMDSRMDIFSMLGLEVGDAHVIRNAGGIVTDDVIRSLCLSQRLLGTREIVLIHHTNCGLEGVSDAHFAAELQAETGRVPSWLVGGFVDPAEDVRRSMQAIRDSPFLPHRDLVAGFVFHVDTGRLESVT